MTQFSRRQMVFGGLLTVLHGSCCGRFAHAQVGGGGCWIDHSQSKAILKKATQANTYSSGAEKMEPRSGNTALDRALARSLANISKTFNVLPSFSYYDDAASPNAMATDEKLVAGTDGTVIFGLNLLKEVLARPVRADASIIAICAHEFGHIVSYKHNLISQLNPSGGGPFRGEQFADYFSGYFAGTWKAVNPSFPAVAFAVTQRDFGGGDHGSGDQRGNAVQQGFLDAYQNKLGLDQAIQAAFDYSMNQSL